MHVTEGACHYTLSETSSGERLIHIFWTANAAGDVTATFTELPPGVVVWISQKNISMSASTTYTARIYDSGGKDMLAGKGKDLTETTGRINLVSADAPYRVGGGVDWSAALPVIAPGMHHLVITGAGAGKAGVLTVAVR